MLLPAVALALVISFSAITGASAQSTDVASPVLKDAQGNELSKGSAEKLMVISVTTSNSMDDPVPFVAIIESRDGSGVTQLLGFSTGSIEDGSQSETGISWTPQEAGSYQLRTFLISGFEDPEILTGVRTSPVVIE
jgi:hypothetical protein